MKLFLVLFMGVPLLVFAEQAPDDCTQHFLKGEMPTASSSEVAKPHQLCFEQFALLESGERKTPIWVAEHLTADHMAQAKHMVRKDAFHAEVNLPLDERSELSDYVHSGFARGHMAPSGDMPTKTSQWQSFSLANMIPQNNRNNSVYWSGIEKKVRELASEDNDIYVVTGPVFPQATEAKTIGNEVAVPPEIFKAVYDPAQGLASAYLVTNETQTKCQIVSLEELEKVTGIEIFPTLSDKLKDIVVALPAPKNLQCAI